MILLHDQPLRASTIEYISDDLEEREEERKGRWAHAIASSCMCS
jgi:hypothetical protein